MRKAHFLLLILSFTQLAHANCTILASGEQSKRERLEKASFVECMQEGKKVFEGKEAYAKVEVRFIEKGIKLERTFYRRDDGLAE